MEQSSQSYHKRIWKHRARSVAKKKFAWCLEVMNLPLAITALLTAAGIVVVRYFERLSSYSTTVSLILFTISAIAFVCWILARKKFEAPEQSLVRIEDTMKLRNALTVAEAGVT